MLGEGWERRKMWERARQGGEHFFRQEFLVTFFSNEKSNTPSSKKKLEDKFSI